MFLIKLGIFSSAIGLFVLFYEIFYQNEDFMFKDNYVLGGVYLVVLLVLCFSYRCFQIGILRVRELIFSFILALVLTNIISWAQISLMFHQFISMKPFLLLFGSQVLAATLLYIIGNKVHFTLFPPRNALAIVVDTEADRTIVDKFCCEQNRYRICEQICESAGMTAIKEAIDRWPQTILCRCNVMTRQEIVKYCYENDKRLYLVPSIQDVLVNCANICQIDDTIIFLFKNRQITSEQKIFKRMTDIVLSGMALLLLSPFMFVAMLAIKIHDGGPALFRQTRLTQNGRRFQLLKFRTMIVNAEESGPQLAEENDSRITPVGKWLRRCRFDELPQLINILRGDMSIVGPRPERPEIMEQECKVFPEFRYRLKMKAGLTGYAQIFGRYNTAFEDKIKLDLLYIERFSLRLDFFLMLSTVKVLFMPSSSKGVKKTKKENNF